ncbi:MAG: quinone-dependent dihydroorotate dehydrogenase [Propionibacteriaceae bacterium]|jgi:dihydroorotate dehydrogenase|nr:quinone-dependent dihydroorotate dehydrogenase [Propionibacteriaceae bacterium]
MIRAKALMTAYGAVRPALFRAYGGDPERVHEAVFALLGRLGPAANRLLRAAVPHPGQPVTVAGIDFPGRVGLAAGLDKDGVAARAWASLGFGFAELGTVTACPQPGNPKPRLFRLPENQALINRMGFNNRGAGELAARLRGWGVVRGRQSLGLPLGVSLGKTKAVGLDRAVDDYRESLRAVADVADYIAVNVSSPNTPGLRDLQTAAHLTELLTALTETAAGLVAGGVPLFAKVAPDLGDAQLDAVAEAAVRAGAAGFIAVNTTTSRDGLRGPEARLARETGGLSGAPLARRARTVVRRLAASTCCPVIGSGGVMTAADAAALFDAGAALVQVCTGFIFSGPGLVAAISALPEAKTPAVSSAAPEAGAPKEQPR